MFVSMPSMSRKAAFLSSLVIFLVVHCALGKNEPDEEQPPPPLSAPLCEATTFTPPHVPGAEAISVAASPRHDVSIPAGGHLFYPIDGLSYCEVKVTLHHPGTDDRVLVEVWLPLMQDEWNGRFQATGGAGFWTGQFDYMLGPAIQAGYVASSTDGGHRSPDMNDLSWTLNTNRTLNWSLLQNFALRSLADQVYVGKAITSQYFGREPRYTYWNGCSQGGRQGYVMAQKRPELFDGILANAPAIGLVHLAMGDLWPQVVMKDTGSLLSNCELDYFQAKALKDCDWLDGFLDEVIDDPEVCDFDPRHLLGEKFYCDGKEVDVTHAMIDVVVKIQEGPRTPVGSRIWHGLPYGTSTHWLASIGISPEGARSLQPFSVSKSFVQYLVLQNPTFNVSSLTYRDYFALWAQASYELDWAMYDNSPDLSGLRSAGTKLLTWHGISDGVIPYQNTVEYRKRVELQMGGAAEVDDFYRLFLAPGVDHCGMGKGPVPKDPLDALVDWVEKGEAPETLDAETRDQAGELVTRALCAWPGKAKYMGIGDAKRWSSWSCEGGTERSEHFEDNLERQGSGRAREILGGLKERLEGLGLGLRIG